MGDAKIGGSPAKPAPAIPARPRGAASSGSGISEKPKQPASSSSGAHPADNARTAWVALKAKAASPPSATSDFAPAPAAATGAEARAQTAQQTAPSQAADAAAGVTRLPELAGTGRLSSVPPGLQANAHRGAEAARALGFGGAIGGLGHRSNKSDHPHGNAIDLMTSNRRVGDTLAAYYVQNAEKLGVKYVIWNGQIASPKDGWKWRPYTHPSGGSNATLDHKDHVHVSFHGGPSAASSGSPPAYDRSPQAVARSTPPLTADEQRAVAAPGGRLPASTVRDQGRAAAYSSAVPASATGTPEGNSALSAFVVRLLLELLERLGTRLDQDAGFQQWLAAQGKSAGAATQEDKAAYLLEKLQELQRQGVDLSQLQPLLAEGGGDAELKALASALVPEFATQWANTFEPPEDAGYEPEAAATSPLDGAAGPTPARVGAEPEAAPRAPQGTQAWGGGGWNQK